MRSDLAAAILAIVGSLLMAVATDPSVAFTLLLASCVTWVVYSARRRLWPLCAQMVVFGLFCLAGVWNAWLGRFLIG